VGSRILDVGRRVQGIGSRVEEIRSRAQCVWGSRFRVYWFEIYNLCYDKVPETKKLFRYFVLFSLFGSIWKHLDTDSQHPNASKCFQMLPNSENSTK
jgi:hypothetical protein